MVAIVTWLVPAVLGGAVILVFAVLATLSASAETALQSVVTIGFVLILSPLVSIFILPFALLAAATELWLGWGGSGVAVLGGALLAGVCSGLYNIFDPSSVALGMRLFLTPAILIHALVL